MPSEVLDGGRAIVESAARTWRIPAAMLGSGRDEDGWARESADTVAGLLAPQSRPMRR